MHKCSKIVKILNFGTDETEKERGPMAAELVERIRQAEREAENIERQGDEQASARLRQAGEDGRPQGPPLRRGGRIAAAGR